MRDDELRRLLTESNPWWTAAARGADPTSWVAGNRTLRERTRYELGYRSGILADIASAEPDGRLVVLTGPRRIGKSVALLDAAADLCTLPGLDPRQIIYVPCDTMRGRDVTRTLTLARMLTRSLDQPATRPRVWLFDEISMVSGWTSALKLARDTTAFGDDSVVVTGSRWAQSEDIQGNLLAGRAGASGTHRIRQLLPMSFRDFLTAAYPELPTPAIVNPARLQGEDARAALDALQFVVDDLDLAWQDYLTCGGFPRAVFEHTRAGAVSDGYARDLHAWLRRDVDPDAPINTTTTLLRGVGDRMSAPINLTQSASDLGYANRPTFTARVERLISTHAALRCNQVRDRGERVVGAHYKLYLTDPLLSWIPSIISPGLPVPDYTRLTEAALGVTLARAIEALDEGRWLSDDAIGYARTESNNEVDFAPVRVPVAGTHSLTVPIEAKWVDAGWRGEARVIDGKYGRGILATKSVLDTDGGVWAVPAPLVALLLA
ncbi:ATP-binding protein [Humibacter albus]|uniref:ATP-binding protein n=1 Tax=Humibacter albus TaxID=427754 RepID=UPI0003B74E3B|nr:AAA family ATPase [Humibacter albus]